MAGTSSRPGKNGQFYLKLPEIRLEIVAEEPPIGSPGFLSILRRTYRAHYPDGQQSLPFEYDQVQRRALDAVVFIAHFGAGGERWVYLRSAVRPPVLDRSYDRPASAGLWELPAGLVEPDEATPKGVRLAAQRELGEELGFVCMPQSLSELGPSVFVAPGLIAEKLHFFEIEVDPATRGEPVHDGSPLEHGGAVACVKLKEALSWCQEGKLADIKTEFGLRRLMERFA